MYKLENEIGSVTLSNDVFTWLAGDAATRCFGVKGMAAPRKENGLVQLLRKESMSKGVTVRMEGNTVAIELHIVVDHGLNLMAVTESIRKEVSYKVCDATGVKVERVDVYIDSVVMD